jgi:hypothetical protein
VFDSNDIEGDWKLMIAVELAARAPPFEARFPLNVIISVATIVKLLPADSHIAPPLSAALLPSILNEVARIVTIPPAEIATAPPCKVEELCPRTRISLFTTIVAPLWLSEIAERGEVDANPAREMNKFCAVNVKSAKL